MIICPCCSRPLEKDDIAFEAILVNRILSLRAQVVDLQASKPKDVKIKKMNERLLSQLRVELSQLNDLPLQRHVLWAGEK